MGVVSWGGALAHAPVTHGVVDRLLPGGRQFNVPGPMQFEHQTPAHHVPQLAIGLNPIPRLTGPGRECPPTQGGIFRDQVPEKPHLGGPNLPTAKTEQDVRHARQFKEAGAER